MAKTIDISISGPSTDPSYVKVIQLGTWSFRYNSMYDAMLYLRFSTIYYWKKSLKVESGISYFVSPKYIKTNEWIWMILDKWNMNIYLYMFVILWDQSNIWECVLFQFIVETFPHRILDLVHGHVVLYLAGTVAAIMTVTVRIASVCNKDFNKILKQYFNLCRRERRLESYNLLRGNCGNNLLETTRY